MKRKQKKTKENCGPICSSTRWATPDVSMSGAVHIFDPKHRNPFSPSFCSCLARCTESRGRKRYKTRWENPVKKRMKKKSNRGDLNARTVRQTEVCKYWDYDENDDIMEYKSPAVRWSLEYFYCIVTSIKSLRRISRQVFFCVNIEVIIRMTTSRNIRVLLWDGH